MKTKMKRFKMGQIFTIFLLANLIRTTFTLNQQLQQTQQTPIPTIRQAMTEALDPVPCTSCGGFKSESYDKELATVRVEFIKEQILKKLKLKEVPRVSLPTNRLPIPIMTKKMYESSVRKRSEEKNFRGEDDFFGTTNQVILFPEESWGCNLDDPANLFYPTICFTFQLPNDINKEDLSITKLWLYKEKDFFDGHPSVNQTLDYSEIIEGNNLTSSPKQRLIGSHNPEIAEGWIELDILETVKTWLEFNDRRYTIQIMCKTCGFLPPWSPISTKKERLPFLLINTKSSQQKKRPKRQVNCIPGISECCREKLYISFEDIGWSHWIIQPKGYEAYFCKGSCTNAAAQALVASTYSALVAKLIRSGKMLDLATCCTPTRLSALEMIYVSKNNSIIGKSLPNMVVETCGCM